MRFASVALAAVLAAAVSPAWGGDNTDSSAAAAVAGEVAHKQKMLSLFPDVTVSTQATPPVIRELETDRDPSGMVARFQPNGPTNTATNAFFQQWAHLLHLSPTAGWLDPQRTARTSAL